MREPRTDAPYTPVYNPKFGAMLGTFGAMLVPCRCHSRGIEAMQRECDFQRAVIDLARLCGWRVFHARPALTRAGEWRTPLQGDAGFPDLVLCRPPRVIFAELKRVGARPTPQQQGWLDALHACAGVECYLWTPSDWEAIVNILRR